MESLARLGYKWVCAIAGAVLVFFLYSPSNIINGLTMFRCVMPGQDFYNAAPMWCGRDVWPQSILPLLLAAGLGFIIGSMVDSNLAKKKTP